MKKLLEQINTLSVNDRKTLSQKGLKLMEEAGELAKAILPYEGACGSNHRIPNRDKVAEECADSMLVAYSIMKSLQMSDEDIITIIQRKTDYWQFLQHNEHATNLDGLFFEFHVTVKVIEDLATFKKDCADLGVKPIILELFTEGRPIKDMMTSSHFKGTTKEAVEESKKLVAAIKAKGYEVVREKIETVPWHPASKAAHLYSPERYFEAHLAYPHTMTDEEKATLNHRYKVKFSRNMMKKDDKAIQMGTLRRKASLGKDAFELLLTQVICDADAPLVVEKPIIEYALFDDNQKHDREWIS